jgi:nicotinamide-nucleotide amidase
MQGRQNMHDQAIPDRVGDLLLKNKQTVAVAESVTSGHLQVAFSLADNAREFFQGGITVYNAGQKARHLNVDPILAVACNSVSEEVAAQMARNVTHLFTSDWGIGITGYASPVPEKNIHKLFACYAIYFRDTEKLRDTVYVENNSPLQVQLFYTQQVIQQLLKLL